MRRQCSFWRRRPQVRRLVSPSEFTRMTAELADQHCGRWDCPISVITPTARQVFVIVDDPDPDRS